MTTERLNWRSFAHTGETARNWNSPGTPTFYILDPKGAIRRKWVGHPGEKTIDAALKSLIEEAERRGKDQPM